MDLGLSQALLLIGSANLEIIHLLTDTSVSLSLKWK